MTPTTEERRRRSPSDYVFGRVLGEGSFSTVYLAKDLHTNKEHASKSNKFKSCHLLEDMLKDF